jgi:hypothetical protein
MTKVGEATKIQNLRNEQFIAGGRALSNMSKMRTTDDAKWRFNEYRCGFGSGSVIRYGMSQTGFRPRQKGDKVIMKQMTTKAKRKIRIAAKDLDWQHLNEGSQKPHFATLTAPIGHEGERIMEYAWRNLNRAIVRRYQPLHNEEFQWVKVSQVQPERLKKRGERVIHFHFIWNYAINKTELMRLWKHSLNLAYKADAKSKNELLLYQCPSYVRVENVPVEASAEQYITKYLSTFDPDLAIQGNNYSISRNLLQHTKPTRKHEVDCNYGDFIEVLSETLYELRDKPSQDLNVIAIQDELKGEILYMTCNNVHTMKEFLWLMSDKLCDKAYPINRPKGVGDTSEPTEGWA